jgi:hypothetical protein
MAHDRETSGARKELRSSVFQFCSRDPVLRELHLAEIYGAESSGLDRIFRSRRTGLVHRRFTEK